MTPRETRPVAAPQARAGSCSLTSAALREPAPGTATRARFWVALEQNGPWGAKAAVESHLDPQVGADLEAMCAEAGGRFILIRRPGQHADHGMAPARVLIAYSGQGADNPAWLLRGTVAPPERLGEGLDLAALSAGDADAVSATWRDAPTGGACHRAMLTAAPPVVLVCTNGRRDVCCALTGRPIALAAGALLPGQVWECSHTGGHRFAPTGLLLPHGRMLARLTPQLVTQIVAAAEDDELAGEALGPVHDRGGCALSPEAQAVEAEIRARHAITSLTALSVDGPDDLGVVRVRHTDGRSWTGRARKRPLGGERPVSCGKAPEPAEAYEVHDLSAH